MFAPIEPASPPHTAEEDIILNPLRLLKDQMIAYITANASRPWFSLLASDYLAAGGSGHFGLNRAETFLDSILNPIITEYNTSKTLKYRLCDLVRKKEFGDLTTAMITPTVTAYKSALLAKLGITTSFTTPIIDTYHNGEFITAYITNYNLSIGPSGPHQTKLTGSGTFKCDKDTFIDFLEDYLVQNRVSLPSPPSDFPASLCTAFKIYELSLIEIEKTRQDAAAQETKEKRKRESTTYAL